MGKCFNAKKMKPFHRQYYLSVPLAMQIFEEENFFLIIVHENIKSYVLNNIMER